MPLRIKSGAGFFPDHAFRQVLHQVPGNAVLELVTALARRGECRSEAPEGERAPYLFWRATAQARQAATLVDAARGVGWCAFRRSAPLAGA